LIKKRGLLARAFLKVNGEWKFQHLHAIGRMAAPYEKGWPTRRNQQERSEDLVS
jgi:hypothetical protein